MSKPVREIFDFATLVDNKQELIGNSVRRAFEFDAYSDQDTFEAIVLTTPIPQSANQLSSLISGEISGSNRVTKFSYRARIVGNNSPHLFLPNPCDSVYVGDPGSNEKLIAMHTLFISHEEYGVGTSLPRIGSKVQVKLSKNVNGYNLQIGEHLKVVARPQIFSGNNPDCTSLQSILNNDGNAISLGNIPVTPQKVANDGVEFMQQLRDSGFYPKDKFSDAYLAGVAANARNESNFNASIGGDHIRNYEKKHREDPQKYTTIWINLRKSQAINSNCSWGLFQMNICGGAGGKLLKYNGLPNNEAGSLLTDEQKVEALQILTSFEKQIEFVAKRSTEISALRDIMQTTDPIKAGQFIAHYFEKCAECYKPTDSLYEWPEEGFRNAPTPHTATQSQETRQRGQEAKDMLNAYNRLLASQATTPNPPTQLPTE